MWPQVGERRKEGQWSISEATWGPRVSAVAALVAEQVWPGCSAGGRPAEGLDSLGHGPAVGVLGGSRQGKGSSHSVCRPRRGQETKSGAVPGNLLRGKWRGTKGS